MRFHLIVPILLGLAGTVSASQGYYRSPALHKDTVVFTAEGDLWLSQLGQSTAKRLTTHPAEEKQAAISSDGASIAFLANYEGHNEVYVIPVKGGIAKRVSFENSDVRVQGWTSSGKVIYSTNNRIGPTGNWTLRTVDPLTLVAKDVQLADAVEGTIDSNEQHIYFTQFGLQVSTDNTKTYRGGAKGEIWHYQLNSSQEANQLTIQHKGSARQPMLHQDKVYFISDASGNDNIWVMGTDGSNQTQITHYTDWPIRSAKLNNGRIIYQLGADLKLYNLTSSASQTLNIELTSDFPNLRERWINQPLKYMNSTRLAGDHSKVVITARGRVAIASTKKSRLVEVATPADSRTRNAILSHDGKWVYAINDASGEMEIWQFSADGSEKSKQLTKDGTIFRWNLSLSPDGKWIAHDDKNGDLWLMNINTRDNRKILSMSSGLDPVADMVWSPDSQLLAITRIHQQDERSRILLYSLQQDKYQTLTSDKYNSYSPGFSPDGKWVYFLSDRYFSPTPTSPWGDRNMGPSFDRRALIYAYGLTGETQFPFMDSNELMTVSKKEKDKNVSNSRTYQKNWKKISSRLWQVPVPSGNYSSLKVSDKFIYVMDQISEPESKPSISAIKIEPSPKIKTFAKNVAQYSLSDDAKRMFVRQQGNNNNNLFIVDVGAKFPKDPQQSKVATKDWQLLISPASEWEQMFHDAWLMHRDSLYDKNMRGVDWGKMKQKYQPLLARLTDRYELNDVFAQMMGELNALHSQVRGGDYPTDESTPKAAVLGALYEQTSKGVQISHIYRHDPELPMQASPLLHPAVEARHGDIITSLNGKPVKTIADLNTLLRNQAGKQVLITLQRGKTSLKRIITPASTNSDYSLRYNDWVNQKSKAVESSHDDIGYLHIHAMGSRDIARFARDFYANYQKQGLIIDVRRNRGGNIDSWIIEKLLRRAWAFWQPTIGTPSTNMQQTFRGHLVVLTDQFTYSDGETFAAGIKALNLAPIIGKQTAGAGVWLSGGNRLVDNGIARVAEYPQYAIDGRWVIEGYGVEPTIEVDNLPHATYRGEDAQLTAAIDYLKTKIKEQPVSQLKAMPFPAGIAPAEDIK